MVVRNFDNIINGYIVGYDPSVAVTENNWLKGVPCLAKNTSGIIYRITQSTYYGNGLFGGSGDSSSNSFTSGQGPRLLLGSNDADEHYNDYKVELIKTLSVSSYRGVAYSTENGVHRCVLSKTFTNNTAEDVIVKEMGVFTDFSGQQSGSSSVYGTTVLVAREKLAEPVTIPANGGVATFTMNINIPVVDNSAS